MRQHFIEVICRWLGLAGSDRDDVQADIRDEIEFQIERLREELTRDGVAENDIERRIAERFGDPDRYARACEHLARRDRIMLQRVNCALLVLVVVTLAWIMHGGHNSIREQTQMLRLMQTKLDAMSTRSTSPQALGAIEGGLVHVVGTVMCPGSYTIPETGSLTAPRVVSAAGRLPSGECVAKREVLVQRSNDAQELVTLHRIDAKEFTSDSINDIELRAGDIVDVR